MPVVTKITQQKRSSSRFNIFLDGVYAFALEGLDFSTSGLREGDQLSAEEVASYQKVGQQDKLHATALRFLSYRARSCNEMREYLRRKSWSDQEIGEELDRLQTAGLLNDREFVAAWIATYIDANDSLAVARHPPKQQNNTK